MQILIDGLIRMGTLAGRQLQIEAAAKSQKHNLFSANWHLCIWRANGGV